MQKLLEYRDYYYLDVVHLVTLHSASCPAGKGEDTEMNTEGEASEMKNMKLLLMIIFMLRMNVCEATP